MDEKKDDFAEGVKRIKGEVSRFSKKTWLRIAAAVGVIAALAWNEAVKAIFALFFSAAATPLMLVMYALLVTVAAGLVEKSAGKDEEQPASPG